MAPTSSIVVPKRLALVLDCDGTIADDTTTQLLRWVGIDSDPFWADVNSKEGQGWDGTLVWTQMLVKAAADHGRPITRALLEDFAQTQLTFAPGVPQAFTKFREFVRKRSQELRIAAELDSHILTSGLEDLLDATSLAPEVTSIWGSTLAFDPDGVAIGPKSLLSFTEKTKCLFAINKGVSKSELRSRPSSVNLYRPMAARPVPLENMIYIGDGDTDVPCFSIIIHAGGQTIGIRNPRGDHPRDLRPRWGPYGRDYSDGSDLFYAISDRLHDILVRLAER
jgi:hypothetical protein